MSAAPAQTGRHRVLVIGGGFAGLNAARGLADAPVDVLLVDRRNHHLFQPLLYQVATGSLASGEIAPPLRWILRRQRNATRRAGRGRAHRPGGAHRHRARPRRARARPAVRHARRRGRRRDRATSGTPTWAEDAPGPEVDRGRRRAAPAHPRRVRGRRAGARPRRAARLADLRRRRRRPDRRRAGRADRRARARHAARATSTRIDTATARVLLLDAGGQVLPTLPQRLGRRAQPRPASASA